MDRFTGKGGRFVRGRGRLVGPGRVAVGDTEFVAGRGVVVATGTLTEDDGCGNIETHPAGTAFQEVPGHVHQVINNGTDTVQVYATSIPPHGQPGAIPATPDCKPKHGGDDSEDD